MPLGTRSREEGLASDVLHDRHGALAHERDGHRLGAHAVARGPGGTGTLRKAQCARLRLRFQRASLLVPECIAVAMEANGLHVSGLRVDLHHEQSLRHSLLAGLAPLPVPWTSEPSRILAT